VAYVFKEPRNKYNLASKKNINVLNTDIVTRDQVHKLGKSGAEREDFEDNWRLGFKSTWDVTSDYQIQDGRLCSIGSSITEISHEIRGFLFSKNGCNMVHQKVLYHFG